MNIQQMNAAWAQRRRASTLAAYARMAAEARRRQDEDAATGARDEEPKAEEAPKEEPKEEPKAEEPEIEEPQAETHPAEKPKQEETLS